MHKVIHQKRRCDLKGRKKQILTAHKILMKSRYKKKFNRNHKKAKHLNPQILIRRLKRRRLRKLKKLRGDQNAKRKILAPLKIRRKIGVVVKKMVSQSLLQLIRKILKILSRTSKKAKRRKKAQNPHLRRKHNKVNRNRQKVLRKVAKNLNLKNLQNR